MKFLLKISFFIYTFSIYSQTKSLHLSFEETVKTFGSFTKLNNYCIRSIWEKITPRDVPADRMVATLVEQSLSQYGKALIIIDSGHAHSIAAGVRLAELGYRVDFLMKHDFNFITTFQAAAAIKHYSTRMKKAKEKTSYGSQGRALVLDSHREQYFLPRDFPTVQEVKEKFGNRVVWVTEPFFPTKHENNLIRYRSIENFMPVLSHDLYNRGFLKVDFSKKKVPIINSRELDEIKNWSYKWLLQYFLTPEIDFIQHIADPYYNNTPARYVNRPKTLSESCELFKGSSLK